MRELTFLLKAATDTPVGRQCVLDVNALPFLLLHAQSPDKETQERATHALGNIAVGDEDQTKTVVDAGGLPVIIPLMRSSRKIVVKNAAWTISNILADCDAAFVQVIMIVCVF